MSGNAFQEFEARARADGFDEVMVREWAPDQVVPVHEHPFEARALVVKGEMWLTVGDATQHVSEGGTFHLDPHVPHSERYGGEGATYWVARRNEKPARAAA
jgi:quercetin dioxygenase-like cupin family protein